MWVFIDIVDISTLIGASLVVIIIFFSKFYIYLSIKLIKKKKKKYLSISVFSSTINVIFNWFLIDIIKIPTVIAASLVVGGLFIVRFGLFYLIGLMKK